MGPPINHGAFLVPGTRSSRIQPVENAPSCFERSVTNRFEELNNYSGQLARRKYDDAGGRKRGGGLDRAAVVTV
jgi:hypothetical protein